MAKKGSSSTKKTGKSGAAGNDARRKFLKWDNDGGKPGMASSLDVLLEWLTAPGNYLRWRKESRGELCREIMARFLERGINFRQPPGIRNEIRHLEAQYFAAVSWMQAKGIHDAFEGGVAAKWVEEGVRHLCPQYRTIAPVFRDLAVSDQPSVRESSQGDATDVEAEAASSVLHTGHDSFDCAAVKASDSVETCYKHTSWYRDGDQPGAPSSMSVLLRWLTTPGNYRRWKHQNKSALSREIISAMKKHRIERHTTRSLECKIWKLERQYAAAKDWLLVSRLDGGFAQGKASTCVKAKVLRMCPHFHDLAPVFQYVLGVDKGESASDASADEEQKEASGDPPPADAEQDPPHERQVAQDVEDEPRAPAQASAVRTSDQRPTTGPSWASAIGRFPNVMVQETLKRTITSLDGEVSSPFAKRLRVRRAMRQQEVSDGDSSALTTMSGEQREQLLLGRELEGKLAVLACEAETKQALAECQAECEFERMQAQKEADAQKTRATAALEMEKAQATKALEVKRAEAEVALDVEGVKTKKSIDAVVQLAFARHKLLNGGIPREEVDSMLPRMRVGQAPDGPQVESS
ncbi:hypothetical protein BBJ28_00000954 [Nothophytophthora sp. Chile5]|nr:hypothetical protein BBJ28_00000954 [Nothophytophthora sp. Chile5]